MNNNQVLPNILGVYQGDLVFTFAEVHSQIVADTKNKCVKCAIQFTNPMALNTILSQNGINKQFQKGEVANAYVFLKCPNPKITQILAEKLQQANFLKLGMVGKLTPQMNGDQLQLLLTVEYGQLIAANQIANTLHTDTYTADGDSAESKADAMEYPGSMPQSGAPRNDMKQPMPNRQPSNMGGQQMPPKQSTGMMPGAQQASNDLDIDMSDLGNAPKPEQQPIQQQGQMQGGNPMPGSNPMPGQQRMQPQGNSMRPQGQQQPNQNPMMSAAGYNQGQNNPMMDQMPQMPR